MTVFLYSNTRSQTDYHDATLFCLLWHRLGRASEVSQLRNQNISIEAGGMFFVHVIRIKTSEEQGLTLAPNNDCPTCPLLSIVVALVSQVAPESAVFANLPEQHKPVLVIMPTTPLIDLLDNPAGTWSQMLVVAALTVAAAFTAT